MGRLATSWTLTKESWAVVKQDKELLWMPVLSFIATVLSILAIVGVSWFATPSLFTGDAWNPANTVVVLLMYLVLAFIGVYFHAATVAAAHERLEGGNPTVGSGLRKANQHLGKLFLWSIMVATVNVILQALRERGGMVGQIVAGIGGAAWNLATFFVVPNLLFSDDGVKDSLGASGRLFKQRWGETIVGHAGIGMAMGLIGVFVAIMGVMLTIGLASVLSTAGFIIGAVITVTALILVSLIATVLAAVFKAALYRFAQTKEQGAFTGLTAAVH